jgi:phage gpG-like protein
MEYFRILWRIEGVPELSRVLALTHSKVSNFKKPLWSSAKLILQDVERNFTTEGGLVGGWTPLAESTIRDRIRQGYGGAHPILQRTGALRKSFYSLVDSKRAVITSKSPYFGYHQSRQPRKRIPRRAMLVLTERTRQNIVEQFHKFLRYK